MDEKLYELWFRMAYRDSIQQKKLKVALRPGDRRYPNPKGVKEGELAKIKIILKPGDEEKGSEPVLDKLEPIVRIKKITVKSIDEHFKEEQKGCLPGCQNKETAKHELGLIYNRGFKDEDIVSMLSFDYVT